MFIRLIRNLIGRSSGYASCASCSDRYNWTPYKIIYYSSSAGMMPICQDCYNRCSVDEIMVFVHVLVNKWRQDGLPFAPSYDEILDGARRFIETDKQSVMRIA